MELKNYLLNLFKRTILAITLFFLLSYFLNIDTFYYKYKDIIFGTNIDFAYIKSKTNYLFGKMINDNDNYVISEKLKYKTINKYLNGYELIVDYNYVINNIESGVITYIGNYENLNNSIVIKGDNGVTYIYSNIENISLNPYDYIKKGTPLGTVINNKVYLTFIKDDNYLNYEDFI